MTTMAETKTLKNPAIVLYGAKNARIQDSPVPQIEDPQDVIVRINFVGVCGSDVSTRLQSQFMALADIDAHITYRSTSGIMVASENLSTRPQA